MSSSPSRVFHRWRLSLMLAACAAAGAGLRWSVREGGAAGKEHGREGEATAGSGARQEEKVRAASVRPTVALLLQLPAGDRLFSVVEMLPSLSAEEVSALVHAQFAAGTHITDEEVADGYLRALFTRWAELDAPGMVAALESPALLYELHARQLTVLAWAELRGPAALEAIGKKWPRLARTAAWEMLRRRPGEMESLLPWLKGGGDGASASITLDGRELVELLGPERSMQAAAAIGIEEMLLSALGAFAADDLPRALAAVKALPAGKMRNAALKPLLEELDVQSAGSALAFRVEYEALPPGKLRDDLAPRYAEWLALENPDNALQWARTLPSGKLRGDVLEHIAGRWKEGASSAEITRIYAEAWITDPSSHCTQLPSANDVAQVTNNFVSENSVRHHFRNWYQEDAAAAESWLKSVSNPDLRAELIQVLIPTAGHGLSLLDSSEMRLAYAEDVLFRRSNGFGGPRTDPDLPPPEIVPPEMAPLAALHAGDLFGVSDEKWAAASTEDRRFISEGQLKSLTNDGREDMALLIFNAMTPEERSLGAWYQAGKAQASLDVGEASQWMESPAAGAGARCGGHGAGGAAHGSGGGPGWGGGLRMGGQHERGSGAGALSSAGGASVGAGKCRGGAGGGSGGGAPGFGKTSPAAATAGRRGTMKWLSVILCAVSGLAGWGGWGVVGWAF